MDSREFRRRGKEMVDYIADYMDNIRDRKVAPCVRPGYMSDLMSAQPPQEGENWDDIMADIERVIMPGMTHWRSPRFHGYFAAGGSYPSLMGDMLCDAFGCIGFSWASSPACTELEVLTTDWLGKMLSLPSQFLHCGDGSGGGVIQSTASETVFLCVLAARNKKIKEIQEKCPDLSVTEITGRLVCYSSDQSNSSVHRAGILAEVSMRKLLSDETFRIRGDVLKAAVEEDKAKGLIPFFFCATLGTTGTCSFDDISDIGPICTEESIWLHVDAAYAGSAFVCPEFRHLMKGIEHAETFSVNPHKWMLIHFDLSVMWIQHRELLVDAFNVDPIYLRHQNEGKVPDYRHWQIPLGRRFRSLKLWFVIRNYGVKGIQHYIREHVRKAHELKNLLLQDGRFEIPVEVVMGLVCFRLKGPNTLTELLHNEIISGGEIYLIPAYAKAKGREIYFLRLAIVAEEVTTQDLHNSLQVILKCATLVLAGYNESNGNDVNYKPVINIDAHPGHLTQNGGSKSSTTDDIKDAGDVTERNGEIHKHEDISMLTSDTIEDLQEILPLVKMQGNDIPLKHQTSQQQEKKRKTTRM